MKIDTVFFGTEGICLSSTSANHIANLAKEFVKGHQRDLEGMHFTEKKVGALGMGAQSVLQRGADESDLAEVSEKITEIGEANSLIAWLREGIKAKNAYIEYVENATEKQYCALEGIDPQSRVLEEPNVCEFMREHGIEKRMEHPEPPKFLTESEVVDGWDEEKRLQFMDLQEEHKVLTRSIGSFNETLRELIDAQDGPVHSVGVGDQVTVYQKHPTVALEKVDDTLQHFLALRRGVSNKLREFRNEIAAALREDRNAKTDKYREEMKAYEKAEAQYQTLLDQFNKTEMGKYNKARENLVNDLKTYKVEKGKEVGNLKIVIPASLVGIYQKVAVLGKK